jgi:hypothetical protein
VQKHHQQLLIFPRRHGWLLLLVLLLEVQLRAQEAVRMSLAGDAAAAAHRQAQATVGYYNLLWGPVALRFSAASSAEYTDNARSSTRAAEGDLIIRPSASLQANWPVTEWNTLNLDLTAGYSFYAQSRDQNQFYVSPGSGLSFDIHVQDWVFTLHDRAHITENTYENPTYTGRLNEASLENDAGITGLWDLDQTVVNIGFDHVNYTSLSGQGVQPDSTSENFFLNAALKIRPELLIGLEGGLGLIDYTRTGATNRFYAVPDALQWSAGCFSSWQVSEHLSARLDAGHTVYSPDQRGTNALPESGSLYFQASVSHVVNAHVSYTLTAGHSVDFGYNGQPVDRYFVQLSPAWNFINKFQVSPSFRWEQGQQVVAHDVNYEQYTVGILTGWTLTQKLSTSMYYHWVMETSIEPSLNYTANIVGLSLNYQF